MRETIQDAQFLSRVSVVIDIFSTSILLEALAPSKLSTVSGYKGVKDLNIIHFAYTPNVLRPSLEKTAKDAITSEGLRLGSYLLEYVNNVNAYPFLKTNTAFGYLMLASPLLYVIIKALTYGGDTDISNVVSKYHHVIIEGLKKENIKSFYLALRKASIKHLGEYFGKIPSVNTENDSILENFSLFDVLKESMYLDLVSHEIVTGFRRVLEVYNAMLNEELALKKLLDSVTLAHMRMLSSNIDTLVLKSKNLNCALLLKYLSTVRTVITKDVWDRIDNYVRENELNPGSISDIVAAGLALRQVSAYITQSI